MFVFVFVFISGCDVTATATAVVNHALVCGMTEITARNKRVWCVAKRTWRCRGVSNELKRAYTATDATLGKKHWEKSTPRRLLLCPSHAATSCPSNYLSLLLLLLLSYFLLLLYYTLFIVLLYVNSQWISFFFYHRKRQGKKCMCIYNSWVGDEDVHYNF